MPLSMFDRKTKPSQYNEYKCNTLTLYYALNPKRETCSASGYVLCENKPTVCQRFYTEYTAQKQGNKPAALLEEEAKAGAEQDIINKFKRYARFEAKQYNEMKEDNSTPPAPGRP